MRVTVLWALQVMSASKDSSVTQLSLTILHEID